MTSTPPKNVAHSVRDRLRQVAHARGEEFNFVLLRYGLERLLYRLSKSGYEPEFILKGAMLLTIWSKHPHRATKDLDLLGTKQRQWSAFLERSRVLEKEITLSNVVKTIGLFLTAPIVAARDDGAMLTYWAAEGPWT